MTFAVPDTAVTSSAVRKTVLVHATFSFALAAGVLTVVVGLVPSLVS